MENINELRAFSLTELKEKLLELRKQQLTLRTQRAFGSLEKTHQFKLIKKAIAQIKTIITEKVGKDHDK